MSASAQSTTRAIELMTRFELDGEMEHHVQRLHVQFLTEDTAVVMLSSGILEDFRLLFGDRVVVSRLADGAYELVGIEHPSPMRHFESAGGDNAKFPTEAIHRIGGDWELELMSWTTHIPAAELDAFCASTGLAFPVASEIFSGLSSVLLDEGSTK